MAIIRFNNSTNIYNVSLSYSGNRVVVNFDSSEDLSSVNNEKGNGFCELNEHNRFIQGDFSDYKYIYKESADGLSYVFTTDSEDIYVEKPASENDELIVEPVLTLEDIKNNKINQLSSICNNNIVNGVDVVIGDDTEHFSYKSEDQNNIKELFDLAVNTNVPLYYHADGDSCKLYTVEQIVNIYSANAINKMHHITYFNQLKLYVESLDDKETINIVTYGDELPGDYLTTYTEAMEQAKLGLETLLGK